MSPLRILSAAGMAALCTMSGSVLAQAPAAPLLPTPAPSLPPAVDSYEPQPILPAPSVTPSPVVPQQSYYPPQPDHVVGPSYVPPQPVAPAVPYGQPSYGAPLHTPGAGYVSPPSAVVYDAGRPIRVRYKDRQNIHPFSIRQTLYVPCRNGFGTIAVDVCAPPNCPQVKVKRRGKKIEYDYGDYEVDIIQDDGEVLVDYDD